MKKFLTVCFASTFLAFGAVGCGDHAATKKPEAKKADEKKGEAKHDEKKADEKKADEKK